MANGDNFFGTQGGLEATEGATAIFDALYYAIEILKVFSDELSDAWVVWDTFFGAVRKHIFLCRTVDRDVINIGYYCVRDFGLKDISDIIVEYRNRVSSFHR
jgi:hypothetical protein